MLKGRDKGHPQAWWGRGAGASAALPGCPQHPPQHPQPNPVSSLGRALRCAHPLARGGHHEATLLHPLGQVGRRGGGPGVLVVAAPATWGRRGGGRSWEWGGRGVGRGRSLEQGQPAPQAAGQQGNNPQPRPDRSVPGPPGAPRPADHQVLHLGSVGLGKPQAGEAGGVTPVFLRGRPHNNRAAPRAGGGYRGGRPPRAGGEEGCTHRPAPKGGCVRAWPRRAARAGLVVLMSSGSKRHGMAAHSLAPTQAIRPAP